MGVTVWSPLRSGILTGKYSRATRMDGSSPRNIVLRNLLDDRAHAVVETLKSIAASLETTPSQVALAWLLTRTGVTCPIIGARTVDQFDDNLAALDVRLSEENVAELEGVSRPTLNFPHDLDILKMDMSYPDLSIDGRQYVATDLVQKA